MLRTLLPVLALFLLTACTGLPQGIEPVKPFELERYLGKWYEIARLDHGFERGLSRVTAEYTPREQGGITVINRGYSVAEGAWEKVQGKAFMVSEDNSAHLKVSFFGPFYASYVVFELDQDYQYAFVTGPSRDYLWLLAREPQVSDKVRKRFIELARDKGFELDELIFVDHD
jgi:apolipoprotein D and lipocalin family protein